jgi:hypothetical protein
MFVFRHDTDVRKVTGYRLDEFRFTHVSRRISFLKIQHYLSGMAANSRSHWPRGLRHRSTTARLLRLWVRIPPEAWLFVCCVCCALSGKGLGDGLITHPEESYRLWRVVVCDHEPS